VTALTVHDVETIAINLAKQMFPEYGKIPDLSTRYPGKLESVLGTVNAVFSDRPVFGTVEERAAATLFYLAGGHCFQNGNKRIAVACMLIQFFFHGKWLNVDTLELYEFAKEVAESEKDSRIMVPRILQFFQGRVHNVDLVERQ
jgi:prophage maintenance system killer protein